MKTITEINEALSKEYTKATYDLAPLKDIDGMDYIAWNDSADLANKVFGPLGWSNTLVSCNYREITGEFWNSRESRMEMRTFRGYEAIVRVEVFYMDEFGNMGQVHRDGAGYADVVPQGKKNPLDLAFKAASSDAFSRAVKQLGDYFGLFLYDKDTTPAPRSSSGSSSAATPSNGSAPKYPASDKQKDTLIKNKVPGWVVVQLSGKQASAIMDGLWKQHMEVREAVEAAGIAWVEEEKKKDGLPLGA